MLHIHFASWLIPAVVAVVAMTLYSIGHWRASWWSFFCAPFLLGISLLVLSVNGITAGTKIKIDTVHADEGYAFAADIRHHFGLFYLPAGSLKSLQRIGFTLYEDGNKLRPNDASRAIIQQTGGGAFFYGGQTLYFSSSDNSDPTKNGRKYTLRFNIFLHPAAASVGALLAFALSWWPLRRLAWPGMPGWMTLAAHWFRAGYRESKSSLRPDVPRRRVILYLLIWGVVAGGGITIASHITYPTHGSSPSGSAVLLPRISYYLENRDRYNVIFLGDSQAHYAIHPLLINKAADIRGFNLTYPSTYLPLQYAIIADLAPKIPKTTTVVLDVSFRNIQQTSDSPINTLYPIPSKLALQMWAWRQSDAGLFNNLLFYNRFTHFLAARSSLRDQLMSALNRPIVVSLLAAEAAQKSDDAEDAALQTPQGMDVVHWQNKVTDPAQARDVSSLEEIPPVPDAEQGPLDDARLIGYYSKVPGVDDIQIVKDGAAVTSVLISFVDGSSCRAELMPAYFRAQQNQQRLPEITEAQALTGQLPKIDPAKLKMFEAMLDELKAQNIHVVVNAVEESSIYYQHPARAKRIRDVFQQTIEPLIKARGYDFIRIDWSALGVTDYMDLVHLNCAGAEKAAPLFADKLRPVISR